MAKRWFKKGQGIKDMRSRRMPGLLVLGWLASVVLVAVLAVSLTSRLSGPDESAGGPSETATRADKAEQKTAAAPGGQRPSEVETPAETESPDTRIVGNDTAAAAGGDAESSNESTAGDEATNETEESRQASADASGQTHDAQSSDASSGPSLRLAGPQGLVMTAQLSAPPSSQAVIDWCKQLGARVASVSSKQCMSDGFEDTGERSVEGRPMVLRKIAASSRPAAGRVLLISATHGDEPSSIGTVFGWMKMMAAGGTRYDWHVAPTLNPDGVFHEPATRVNANGVDLNRNLPTTGWNDESRAYWRRVGFEKRRYPGESPGSEPENRWLVKEVRAFQPDVIISLHAPYGVLDYDGDFPAPRKLGRLDLHRLGVYPGSLGNFGARMNSIPVITVELDDARQAPEHAELKRMWDDLNGWLDRYFSSVRQASSENAEGDAG